MFNKVRRNLIEAQNVSIYRRLGKKKPSRLFSERLTGFSE